MQRRKFRVGTAGTAIGSSALIGPSAFTSGVLEYLTADINVIIDNGNAVRLVDLLTNGEVVNYDDGGHQIEFSAGSINGVNTSGVFTLGGWDGPKGEYLARGSG